MALSCLAGKTSPLGSVSVAACTDCAAGKCMFAEACFVRECVLKPIAFANNNIAEVHGLVLQASGPPLVPPALIVLLVS